MCLIRLTLKLRSYIPSGLDVTVTLMCDFVLSLVPWSEVWHSTLRLCRFFLAHNVALFNLSSFGWSALSKAAYITWFIAACLRVNHTEWGLYTYIYARFTFRVLAALNPLCVIMQSVCNGVWVCVCVCVSWSECTVYFCIYRIQSKPF